MGVPLADDKTVEPTEVLVFLGIEGNDKLCISLYSELDLLRITEIGEILNVGKGRK
jgi:hypothetical protein